MLRHRPDRLHQWGRPAQHSRNRNCARSLPSTEQTAFGGTLIGLKLQVMGRQRAQTFLALGQQRSATRRALWPRLPAHPLRVVGRDDDVQGACFNHYMPRSFKRDPLLCKELCLGNVTP
jgi:hypothetical protein